MWDGCSTGASSASGTGASRRRLVSAGAAPASSLRACRLAGALGPASFPSCSLDFLAPGAFFVVILAGRTLLRRETACTHQNRWAQDGHALGQVCTGDTCCRGYAPG